MDSGPWHCSFLTMSGNWLEHCCRPASGDNIKAEVELMHKIHSCAEECLEEIPENLKMNKDFTHPAIAPDPIALQSWHWKQVMPRGALHEIALQIALKICALQAKSKPYQRGPVSAALYEWKMWCFKLAGLPPSEELLGELKRRTEYAHRLGRECWPDNKEYGNLMTYIEQQLRAAVIPFVAVEVEKMQAPFQVAKLIATGTEILRDSVGLLMVLFRDMELNADLLTIEELIGARLALTNVQLLSPRQQESAVRLALRTYTGQWTLALVRGKAVMELLNSGEILEGDPEGHRLQHILDSPNAFMDASGRLDTPPVKDLSPQVEARPPPAPPQEHVEGPMHGAVKGALAVPAGALGLVSRGVGRAMSWVSGPSGAEAAAAAAAAATAIQPAPVVLDAAELRRKRLEEQFTGPYSGVAPAFRKVELGERVLRLHAVLDDFALVLLVFRELLELVKEGSQVLGGAGVHRAVMALLGGFQQMLKLVEDQGVDLMHDACDAADEQRRSEGGARDICASNYQPMPAVEQKMADNTTAIRSLILKLHILAERHGRVLPGHQASPAADAFVAVTDQLNERLWTAHGVDGVDGPSISDSMPNSPMAVCQARGYAGEAPGFGADQTRGRGSQTSGNVPVAFPVGVSVRS